IAYDVLPVVRVPDVINALRVIVRDATPPERRVSDRQRRQEPREIPAQVHVRPEPAVPVAASPIVGLPPRAPRPDPVAGTGPFPARMHAHPMGRHAIARTPFEVSTVVAVEVSTIVAVEVPARVTFEMPPRTLEVTPF